MSKKGRVLCVCQGGNSRSVGMAYLLKYGYKIDAIACGWEGNSQETLDMLCEWAQIIIVMQEKFKEKISDRFRSKVEICDVGEDRYFRGFSQDLINQCNNFIKEECIQTDLKCKNVTVYDGQSS